MSNTDLRPLLKKILPIIEELAESEIYGAPHCDDPHDFRPDRDSNTPAELAAWEEACRRFEVGEIVEVPRHYWIYGDAETVDENAKEAVTSGEAVAATTSPIKQGQRLAHIAHEPWGVGTSTYRDPDMVILRDDIRQALAE